MSATRLRDQIYSHIHAAVFRPRGFRKDKRWIHKKVNEFHFAVERPQHRFESPEHATLGLEVYIFHEAFHSLMIGWPTFPGVDRMSIPAFNRGLRWLAGLAEDFDNIYPSSDVASVSAAVGQAIEASVLPLFERGASLEGLASIVDELIPPSWQKTKTVSGLLLLQGKKAHARAVLGSAIEVATGAELRELLNVQSKLFTSPTQD